MNSPIAVVPILWNNDDIPELTRPETAFATVVDEAARIGFGGIELGSNFPRDPLVLRGELRARGLSLCAAYHARDFTRAAAFDDNLDGAVRLGRFLATAGARVLVLADVLRPERVAVAGRATDADRAPDAASAQMAAQLEAIARRLRPLGLATAFHNHAGTFVETEEEIERLLARTDAEWIRFCLDTGHAVFGGGDPVALVRRHGDRIAHVHLKDVDGPTLLEVRSRRFGFYDALRSFIFCELGRGVAPISGVLDALAAVGYRGWLTVEQDTTRRGAVASAEIGYRALRALVDTRPASPPWKADVAAGGPRPRPSRDRSEQTARRSPPHRGRPRSATGGPRRPAPKRRSRRRDR